jgi:hypothetical protein
MNDDRRCFRAVDPVFNESTELVTIDEQADHEIVHGRRFGTANGATHEPLDPCPQIDMCALDVLCVVLANVVLLWVDMPLVSPPPIRIKAADPTRLQQRLPLQKDRILPSPEDVRQHGATVVIDGMPSPPRLRFLPYVTPHFIELRCQPSVLGQLLGTTTLDLHVLWAQMLQRRVIDLVEVRCLFFNSFRTVVGLTCKTRAVSRMPLAFIAISTICCLTSGDCPA